ncbi:MAG: sulfotransferase [Halieaceae bacterium]|nr:sulfotransferase [Halieaceae bacterium]
MKDLDFLIAGAQKCGTTALASFLDSHPAISMATPKECHLFDSPEYQPAWSREDINRRYLTHFEGRPTDTLWGEATPAYLFYEDIAEQLARYRPDLRIIVLLRDPVERAISQYRMEVTRGQERLPLLLALALEYLGRQGGAPRAPHSAHGRFSYRRRGLYTAQLERLYKVFPAEQVLVIRQLDLLREHRKTLETVFNFLGVDPTAEIPAAEVRPVTEQSQETPAGSFRVTRAVLGALLARERRSLQSRWGISL